MLDDPQSAARELYLAATEVLRYLEASTDRHERPAHERIEALTVDYDLPEGARLRKQAERADKKDAAILRFREAVVCFGASTAQPTTSGGSTAPKAEGSRATSDPIEDQIRKLIAYRDNLRDEINALIAGLEEKRDVPVTGAELVPVLKVIAKLTYS